AHPGRIQQDAAKPGDLERIAGWRRAALLPGRRLRATLGRAAAQVQPTRAAAAISSPPPMQPQPLLRVLAHPALDDPGDGLRGGLHVDAAVAVARRRDLLRELGTEAMVGQADDARAVDRAVEMLRQPRNDRVGLAAAPEELDLDAVKEELVDQDADVGAALER